MLISIAISLTTHLLFLSSFLTALISLLAITSTSVATCVSIRVARCPTTLNLPPHKEKLYLADIKGHKEEHSG